MPGAWKHDAIDLTFTLIVDDFGTKRTGMKQARHLLNSLKDKYKMNIDCKASLHAGVALEWDYINRKVTLSTPGFVKKLLIK